MTREFFADRNLGRRFPAILAAAGITVHRAVIDARATLLIIVGKAPFPAHAASFVNAIDKIIEFLDQHEPPLIAKVYRPSAAGIARNPNATGSVELWYPRR